MRQLGPYIAWLFPAIWLGIVVVLSVKSGWRTLAKAFPSPVRIDGTTFRFASGAMGDDGLPVSYGGCLFVTVGDAGIRLALMFPLRLFSPPMFIAWRDVATVERKSASSWFVATTIRLHGRPQIIRFRGDIGALVMKTWARVGHPGD